MISSLSYWASLLALLLGLASALSLATTLTLKLSGLNARNWETASNAWKILTLEGLRAGRRAVWLFVVLCAGWGLHDIWQFHNTYVIADVTVLRAVSPDRFILSFGDTRQPFAATFCPNYLPPFEAGMKVKSMVYQDRGSCWDLSGAKRGYIFAKDSRGNILREATQ